MLAFGAADAAADGVTRLCVPGDAYMERSWLRIPLDRNEWRIGSQFRGIRRASHEQPAGLAEPRSEIALQRGIE